MMSDRFKNDLGMNNPFDFKYIQNIRGSSQFNDIGPSVVFASPGMLQSGFSRELFERWAPMKRNGIFFSFFFTNESNDAISNGALLSNFIIEFFIV